MKLEYRLLAVPMYVYRTNLSTESETNSSKNLRFLSRRCIDPYDEGRRNYKLVFLKCNPFTCITFTSADSQCVKFSNVSDCHSICNLYTVVTGNDEYARN